MRPKQVRINAGLSHDCLYPSPYLISKHCFMGFYEAEEQLIATSMEFYGFINIFNKVSSMHTDLSVKTNFLIGIITSYVHDKLF